MYLESNTGLAVLVVFEAYLVYSEAAVPDIVGKK